MTETRLIYLAVSSHVAVVYHVRFTCQVQHEGSSKSSRGNAWTLAERRNEMFKGPGKSLGQKEMSVCFLII